MMLRYGIDPVRAFPPASMTWEIPPLPHYGLQAAPMPSISRGRPATRREKLTISSPRHGAAILLTDQRDGSEKIGRLDRCGATFGDPFSEGFGCGAVRPWQGGIVRERWGDRQVHFPHDARVVCACPGQPHRRDLDNAGVARHRPDDEPGPDHRHLPRP